ncbi:glycosyltransferase family 2 protein [Sandaracinobacteroides hominis]|uniref:glycosyltransferase family 2 protein n=1 Tax=Sandaracinobacteroides hominis TaxID=2780086 RepID=UPI0018F4FB43|nr:glycosyltransferase family 2 protein [Sandaracinobacteroides hominis]
MADLRLSICIATFKRADFIAETLDSIVSQLQDGIEVVVVDGCSPDATADVVAAYEARCPQLRYYREAENSGVDADYDKAVGYACGRHVWLMTDDDILVPGSVAEVLDLLDREDPDLLVVDTEIRDAKMHDLLQARRFGFEGLRRYGAGDGDRLLADAGDALSFIGGTVVRRKLWLARDRQHYYGSLFVHVGVLFQKPLASALCLGKPLVQIRFGNAMWSARGFEIWMFLWPQLIWSFAGFSDGAKASVTAREPWRVPRKIFGFRANGSYGMAEFRRFFADRAVGLWRVGLLGFALMPGRLANLLALVFLLASGGRYRAASYVLAWNSRFSSSLGRRLAARSMIRHPA